MRISGPKSIRQRPSQHNGIDNLPRRRKVTVLMLSAQLLVLCATLLGVEGYYEKMKEILKK